MDNLPGRRIDTLAQVRKALRVDASPEEVEANCEAFNEAAQDVVVNSQTEVEDPIPVEFVGHDVTIYRAPDGALMARFQPKDADRGSLLWMHSGVYLALCYLPFNPKAKPAFASRVIEDKEQLTPEWGVNFFARVPWIRSEWGSLCVRLVHHLHS